MWTNTSGEPLHTGSASQSEETPAKPAMVNLLSHNKRTVREVASGFNINHQTAKT
jgi:hypothetical protein